MPSQFQADLYDLSPQIRHTIITNMRKYDLDSTSATYLFDKMRADNIRILSKIAHNFILISPHPPFFLGVNILHICKPQMRMPQSVL